MIDSRIAVEETIADLTDAELAEMNAFHDECDRRADECDDECDDEYDEYDEYDGQPSEYEEWQDFYGGDDWDHGQYD